MLHRRRAVRRAALVVTGGLAVIVAAGSILLRAGTASPSAALPAAIPAAGSLDALGRAADAAGFKPTTDANVGVVEDLPVDTLLLPGSPSLLPVGAQAPDFTLQSPEGERIRLSDFTGRTVLLEFIATWCPHCQAEAQHLLRLHAALPPTRFAFLSVNADSEDAASIYAFHRYFGIPWPTLLDPGTRAGNFSRAGSAGPVTQAFGVALYPTFYIIDPRGRIAWRGDREKPDALLLQELKNASGK
jgi:peroxiredoxin